MTTITCYVDPVCPYAWATSSWLRQVRAEHPDIEVGWRQLSLAALNTGREPAGTSSARITDSRLLGRVVAAAHDPDESIETFYEAIGNRIHREALPLSSEVIAAALAEAGLDPALADLADDDSLDPLVAERHQQSQRALGEPGGSPITVINNTAYFGPVLTAIPDRDESERLLQVMLGAAAVPALAELHRPRSGPPLLTESDD